MDSVIRLRTSAFWQQPDQGTWSGSFKRSLRAALHCTSQAKEQAVYWEVAGSQTKQGPGGKQGRDC